MPISVRSEIGPLRRVLLHRPGKELEHLVPGELERLLFDDIPYLAAARQEHDTFAGILRAQGVEVCYLEDLTVEALEAGDGARDAFLRQLIREGGSVAQRYAGELYGMLSELPARELVQKSMAGVGINELGRPTEGDSLVALTRDHFRFVLDPIPNLYFTRDPFACIGRGVSLNTMYSATRRRETIYGEYILRYHPDYAATPLYYDRQQPFHIEGGDILNLSPEALLIGISQRTMPEAIERLARNLFRDGECRVRRILALDIPSIRAFMHLDTVLTQVDYDKFTVHPEILASLRIYEITPGPGREGLRVRERTEALPAVLAEVLGQEKVQLIRCGGLDRVAAQREQWNDGSNTLCIAPGKVVVYDRNYVTNAILRDQGIQVFETPSSELSRGRGGPRCMSMPLWREDPVR